MTVRTRLALIALLVTSVLSLAAIAGPTGAASSDEYNISIDGSLDVPDRTVTFDGDEFNITEIKAIDPGDTFTAKFEVPSDAYVFWELRNLDKTLYDAGTVYPEVVIDTSDLDDGEPLKPGTYFVALQVDGPPEFRRSGGQHP